VVKLETNTLTEPILRAANRIRSSRTTGAPPEGAALRLAPANAQLVLAENDTEEADTSRVHPGSHWPRAARFGDCACSSAPARRRGPTRAVRARGIPNVLIGGRSFFDRKEVRDVLAYLSCSCSRMTARLRARRERAARADSARRAWSGARTRRKRVPLAQAFEERRRSRA